MIPPDDDPCTQLHVCLRLSYFFSTRMKRS